MNEGTKEKKKREINKFPKLWKEIFRVFFLDKREGLIKIRIDQNKRGRKRKLTIPEKNQIQRYKYLSDKKNNFFKKFTAEEILQLAGIKYSDRTQTHIREHLEKLAKKGVLIKEVAKDRKNKFLWSVNYEFEEGIKTLYNYPDILEGMKENKEAFEISMDNVKQKTRVLKSHAKSIISSNKDSPDLETAEEVYDNWEDKEYMDDLLKEFN